MIDDILNAIVQETKAFLTDTGGTFLLKTDYKATNLPDYSMPLLLLDCTGAPDSMQLLGGVSRKDWDLVFNSYQWMTDPTGDNESGTPRNYLIIIDQLQQHFANQKWLSTITPTMTDILNNYCFKMTFSGIVEADAIEQDGMKMGWRIVFQTVGIDTSTSTIIQSTQVLTSVTQVGNPPFGQP